MQHRKYTIWDFYFWKISLCLALASCFIFASMYAAQPLLPVFVTEFGVTVSTSSLSISLTIAGLIIGLIVLGFLSDQKGRTTFIKLALLGSVIPFLLIPLMDSFILFLVLRFLQGFALAGLPAASIAYISEEIDQRGVGVATALYISSNALGGMMGRVLTGYITDHYSWETAFYFLGVVGIVISVVVFLLLPKSRFFQPSNLSFSRDMQALLFHLRNPALLLTFGIGIILQLSFAGIWTYLPFYLEGPPFSLSLHVISNMFFAYGLGVIGSPLAGILADNFGLGKVRIAGVVTLSGGIFMTLSSSILLIVIGLCITCLGLFTAHSLTAASVSKQAIHHKGSAASLYLVAYYVGVTLGTSATASLWNMAGWTGLVLLTGTLPVVYITFESILSRKKMRSH